MTETNASGAQVPCISLLEARASFIAEHEKKLRGTATLPDDPLAKLIAESMIACAKESAGDGFDAGFKFASNTQPHVQTGREAGGL